MMVRKGLLVLVATAAVVVGFAVTPASALTSGCAPFCTPVAGSVVGSVTVPGDLFKFQGKFVSGDYAGAHFNIEGPYTNGSNGTLKVNGRGAPKYNISVVVQSFDGGFRVRNANQAGTAVNATFFTSGSQYRSDDASVGNTNTCSCT